MFASYSIITQLCLHNENCVIWTGSQKHHNYVILNSKLRHPEFISGSL